MARVYVDTSAVLPRIFSETVTALTEETFARHHRDGDDLLTSRLTVVEASRAARARWRREGGGPEAADPMRALSGVSEAPIDEGVICVAKAIGPDELRSLDAIHLATAVAVGADVMFTYDTRLADTARVLGLAVEPQP